MQHAKGNAAKRDESKREVTAAGLLIEELADRLGQYAWLEGRLSRLLALWATDEAHNRARLHFHSMSRLTEAHVFMWELLLPDSPALAAADRIAPPADWNDVLEAEAEAEAAPSSLSDRLAVLKRKFLEPLVESLDEFLAMLSPVSEAPEIRHADLVRRDLAECLAATAALAVEQTKGLC